MKPRITPTVKIKYVNPGDKSWVSCRLISAPINPEEVKPRRQTVNTKKPKNTFGRETGILTLLK
jgi:hypothetical protein